MIHIPSAKCRAKQPGKVGGPGSSRRASKGNNHKNIYIIINTHYIIWAYNNRALTQMMVLVVVAGITSSKHL
jgi:hypothetical protein